jgi:hypothetical protein
MTPAVRPTQRAFALIPQHTIHRKLARCCLIERTLAERNATIREACSEKMRVRVDACTINRGLRRADAQANFALPEHDID